MNRVLVIMPNWIGDCLMASPLVRAIRENKKSAYIGVLLQRRVLEIFQANPFVDEIIVFNDNDFFSRVGIFSRLKKKKFDTAILLKPSFTKSLVCKLAGIGSIISYNFKKFTFINKAYPIPSGKIHKIDYYLSLLEGLGYKVTGRIPDFFLTESEENSAQKVLTNVPKARFRIALHPKANWPLKQWPKEYFARLADRLINELGAQVLITGSLQDINLARDVANIMQANPYILAGKTTLRELAGLLGKVDLFISADTGIMHLAASTNTTLIALFGPTDPSLTGPRGKGQIKVIYKNKDCKTPCYKLDCQDNSCMKDISVDEVFKEAEKILG